jgi:hypothetical protein
MSYNLDGTTPIQTVDNQNFATVFPNPTKDYLTIETSENCYLKIVNNLGQIIKTEKNIPPQYKLDLSAFSSGIYFLQLISNTNKTQILKIFKE